MSAYALPLLPLLMRSVDIFVTKLRPYQREQAVCRRKLPLWCHSPFLVGS
jgi:hypothetical protein